jgi:hypothetical protein
MITLIHPLPLVELLGRSNYKSEALLLWWDDVGDFLKGEE